MHDPVCTALVATHDDALARQLAEAVAGEGVRLLVAAGDRHGLVAAARRCAAAAVLVDVALPHGGALAALAALRASGSPPALVFAAGGDLPALRPWLEAGATGYLAGPLRPRDVARALRAAGRGEPVLSAALTRRLLAELREPPRGVRALDARGVTRREREVLGLLAGGRRTAEVAGDLSLSRETVRGHVKSALRKLEVRTCAAAVALLVAERSAPTLRV
jgi:DNA-binding NarL/FixJ family response regulator